MPVSCCSVVVNTHHTCRTGIAIFFRAGYDEYQLAGGGRVVYNSQADDTLCVSQAQPLAPDITLANSSPLS